MNLPLLRGVVRRRLLVNYRVDADAMREWLPEPFQPRLQKGYAVAGICVIRMEQGGARALVPLPRVMASESAAHRVAVRWREGGDWHEGVYVHRCHTSSVFGHLARGRVFPGEPRWARFEVVDDGREIGLRMRSGDGGVTVEVVGHATAAMPRSSIFSSARDATLFLETGSHRHTRADEERRYEGVVSRIEDWAVHPLAVTRVRSTVFEEEPRFPEGSVAFDHALVMRDVEHRWRVTPELCGERTAG